MKKIYELTLEELRELNRSLVPSIHNGMARGKSFVFYTAYRGVKLTKPEHIRLNSLGDIQIPRGRHWDTLISEQIGQLANQVCSFDIIHPDEP